MMRTRAIPSTGLAGGILAARSSVTTLGDSLHFYGVNSTEGFNSTSPILWCNDILAQYGTQLDPVSMLAAASKDLQQVIDEQLPTALIDGTDIAWLHDGVNDLNSTIGNTAVAAMMTLYRTIITALSLVKRIVIVDSINPLVSTGSSGAIPRASSIPQINWALCELCSQFPNVIFNNQYDALVNPASATLSPIANYILTTDGIHYQTLGAQAAGYITARNLIPRIRLTPYKTVGANVLLPFSGTGGTVTAGAGTITGTPPVGYNCQVASGSSAVTITSLAPDMIRFAITNGGVTASTVFIQATNSAALLAASPNGATVQGGCGFQATGITNLTRINMGLQKNGTTNWGGGAASTNEPTIIYPTTNFGGRRKCPPLPIITNLSSMAFIIAINLGALTGAITVDLYNPTFVPLT